MIGEKISTINTDFLKVKGDLICWENTMIQISNISMITTTEVAGLPFPVLSLLIICAGFAVASESIGVAMVCWIISAGWIMYWYKQCQERSSIKKLNFILNSGGMYTLIFNDKNFLNQVSSVLLEILVNKNRKANITFNIKNNTFTDDSKMNFTVDDKEC